MLNLKDLYGKQYRIENEIPKSQDPTQQIIPCRYGHIYVAGPDKLGFYCESVRIVNKMKRDGHIPDQDADTEAVFTFPPAQFRAFATYAKPKRKRQLTAKQRAEIAQRLKDSRDRAQKS